MSGRFEEAVAGFVAALGTARLRALADAVGRQASTESAAGAMAVPGFSDAAREVLHAQRQDGVADAEAAAYLRGVAAGFAQRAEAVDVQPVWTGPGTHPVPVRATAEVLVDVVAESRHELLLMTYSARPYQPLLDALDAAAGRGVTIAVVVETLRGAGNALAGAEPAEAFRAVPGVELWHWPVAQRQAAGAKLHAKIAVADRHTLLVSSANLTQSGAGSNIEAGLLVRGGSAPERVTEHIEELRAQGVLTRLRREGP